MLQKSLLKDLSHTTLLLSCVTKKEKKKKKEQSLKSAKRAQAAQSSGR